MSLYYQNDAVTLHLGDALDVTRALPDASADCIVTSPPYYGLRDYGQDGQYGHEPTVQDFVGTLVALFRECRRVLADDGTFWLNLGDSYGKGKQLLMVPARVAIALQDDGWVLRNSIVWHKTDATPESIRDRMSKRHEMVYLLTKNPRYHFDLDAVRLPSGKLHSNGGGQLSTAAVANGWAPHRGLKNTGNTKGKNPGDVWATAKGKFPQGHFATFHPELPRRAIMAGCKPGGTVLDPFSGSATTGMVAVELGRKYVGVDINPEYHDLALDTRLRREQLRRGDAA